MLKFDRDKNAQYIVDKKMNQVIKPQYLWHVKNIMFWNLKIWFHALEHEIYGHLNSENQKSLSRNGRVIGLPPINAKGTESLWFVKVVFMEKKKAQNIAFSEALITEGLIRSDLELIHADICEPTRTPSLTTEDLFFSSLMIIHRWCGFMAHIWRKRKWAGRRRLENRSWRRIYFQVFWKELLQKKHIESLRLAKSMGSNGNQRLIIY